MKCCRIAIAILSTIAAVAPQCHVFDRQFGPEFSTRRDDRQVSHPRRPEAVPIWQPFLI
jgi:hypothetical protein